MGAIPISRQRLSEALDRFSSAVGFAEVERCRAAVDYISAEQIDGGEIDGRADGYSLACVLFEFLTGTRPLDRGSSCRSGSPI